MVQTDAKITYRLSVSMLWSIVCTCISSTVEGDVPYFFAGDAVPTCKCTNVRLACVRDECENARALMHFAVQLHHHATMRCTPDRRYRRYTQSFGAERQHFQTRLQLHP